jgi:hypothetical protein
MVGTGRVAVLYVWEVYVAVVRRRLSVLAAAVALTGALAISDGARAGLASLDMTVSTTTPAPGETVTVDVGGCTDDVGGVAAVTLLDGFTLVAQGPFPITPAEDGTFSVPVTVPPTVASGTALVMRAVCGDGDVVAASADVAITVQAPPSQPGTAPTTTTVSGTTAPRFTG